MKYYVVRLLTNTLEQDAPSIDVYGTYDAAIVAYHNILAAYHNAADVLFAVVELQNDVGNTVMKEIVDHRPEPEPEPKPEEPVEEPTE